MTIEQRLESLEVRLKVLNAMTDQFVEILHLAIAQREARRKLTRMSSALAA